MNGLMKERGRRERIVKGKRRMKIVKGKWRDREIRKVQEAK